MPAYAQKNNNHLNIIILSLQCCQLSIGQKGLENKAVKLKDIAEEINSPLAFTAKILQKLVKANIIESNRGAKGGFFVTPVNLKKVVLKDIVFAIDGEGSYNGCALGFEKCSAHR